MRFQLRGLSCAPTTPGKRPASESQGSRWWARLLLASLPVIVSPSAALAQSPESDGTAPQASLMVSGLIVASGAVIPWEAFPDASIALIGDLTELDPAAVVLLPLHHASMLLDDWLLLGVDPLSAAALISSLQPGESLSAVLDIQGQVQSVIVSASAPAGSSAGVFVVAAPPQSSTPSTPDIFDLLRDFLRRLREYHGIVPPPPPPPPPPPTGDGPPPGGEW